MSMASVRQLFTLAEEVLRHGFQSHSGAQSCEGREPSAEANVCVTDAGSSTGKAHHRKKVVKPCDKKQLAEELTRETSVSVGRACKVLSLQRSLWYYQSRKDDTEVITKLSELAEFYPTRGFDKYYKIIRMEGLIWARSRVLRIYRQMKLVRRRRHVIGLYLPENGKI